MSDVGTTMSDLVVDVHEESEAYPAASFHDGGLIASIELSNFLVADAQCNTISLCQQT